MEITTVHYQKLVNLGDYENERVGAWGNVGVDESAEAALAQLTEWVLARIDAQHTKLKEEQQLESDLSDKRYELANLLADIKRASEKWDRIVEFFSKREIDMPKRWHGNDDIPF